MKIADVHRFLTARGIRWERLLSGAVTLVHERGFVYHGRTEVYQITPMNYITKKDYRITNGEDDLIAGLVVLMGDPLAVIEFFTSGENENR